MRTSELIGDRLDVMVQEALLKSLKQPDLDMLLHRISQDHTVPAYSTDQTHGEYVIEHMKIWYSVNDDAESADDAWFALTTEDSITGEKHGFMEQVEGVGPTKLIAAMRCFVSSVFGENVE